MGQDDGGGGMKVTIEALNSLDLNEIILEKDRAASAKYHHPIDLEHLIAAQDNEQ